VTRPPDSWSLRIEALIENYHDAKDATDDLDALCLVFELADRMASALDLGGTFERASDLADSLRLHPLDDKGGRS